MGWAALRIALLVALVACACGGVAYGYDSPFVAGFDRFASHSDIGLVESGRLLLSELNCTACHSTEVASLQPKRGPRLEGAGIRLHSSWVRRFLRSPQEAKPGTTMPDVLAGLGEEQKERAILALSAFLATQREPFPTVKATGVYPVPFEFWDQGDAEQGKQLYHQVGCVACHEAADDYETVEAVPSPLGTLLEQLGPEEIEEMGLSSAVRAVRPVPHGDLLAKYTQRSLALFLLDPERVRPDGRMPSLKLGPLEAAHVAAYLLQKQPSGGGEKRVPVDRSLQQEGKLFFVELRCSNCHTATGIGGGDAWRPLSKLNMEDPQSCFAATTKGRPRYLLDEMQTKALSAAVVDLVADKAMTNRQTVELRMLQLNCYACHEREGLGGVGRNRKPYFETVRHVDLGDEGRLPPPLTGVGSKLAGAWLKKVLDGSGDIRPHLVARMPKFPATMVSEFPALFGELDRAEVSDELKAPKKPSDFVEAGRALLDTGCVECHPLRGESLPGVVGVDLEGVADRLEYGWFHDFLLNPAALKPRTRMPTFFPEGVSQSKDVLDGDVELQVAAIWHYLREIKNEALPEKIEKARLQTYELVPSGRPILLRTFMPVAGTHALAVGFSEQVHFAFDTESLRLAQAWRGRFLDAQGTWFERFTPPAEPLGKDWVSLPTGAALAVLGNADEAWPALGDLEQGCRFEGYRLDDEGVPTLLYRVGGFAVRDRIAPNDEGGLTRRLLVGVIGGKKSAGRLWLRGNVGKQLEQVDERSYINENQLRVSVLSGVSEGGRVRVEDDESEWLVPVEVGDEITIEVRYQW